MSGMALFGILGISSNSIGSFKGERLIAGPGPRWLFAAVFALVAAGFLFSIRYRFHEGGAYAVFSTFLANMTRERLGTVNISIFFAAFSSIAIVIRLFLGSLIERKPPFLLSTACFIMVASAFFMTFGLRDPFMLAPIGLVYGIGHSVLFPLLSTLFVNAGSDEERLGLEQSLFRHEHPGQPAIRGSHGRGRRRSPCIRCLFTIPYFPHQCFKNVIAPGTASVVLPVSYK